MSQSTGAASSRAPDEEELSAESEAETVLSSPEEKKRRNEKRHMQDVAEANLQRLQSVLSLLNSLCLRTPGLADHVQENREIASRFYMQLELARKRLVFRSLTVADMDAVPFTEAEVWQCVSRLRKSIREYTMGRFG